MPQSKEVRELLEDMDRLMWWIGFGRYQGCKEIIIPKIKPITAKELTEKVHNQEGSQDATKQEGSR